MPVSWEFRGSTLVVTTAGGYRPEELPRAVAEARADPRFRPGTLLLFDGRLSGAEITTESVKWRVAWVASLRGEGFASRCAVVVSGDPHRYGLGRMASVLLVGEGVELEVFTDSGLDWSLMVPDVQLEIGDFLLQLTKFAAPCANIAGSFRDGDFSHVAQKIHPDWSRICARVVKAGIVRVGDTIRLQDQTRRA